MDDLVRAVLGYLADPGSQPAGSNELFARLAAEKPILRGGSVWIVSRHDLVTKLARNRQLVMRLPDQWTNTPDVNRAVALVLQQLMPIQPPLDHQRLRRLLASEFSAKATVGLRGRVQSIVDEVFAQPLARGECEFVQDVCGPLPVYTTAALLGLPDEDRPRVLEWAQTINALITHELISRVGGAGGQERPAAPATPGSLAEVVGYIEELVEERTRRPGDDIVSRLARSASPEDGKLSRQELIAMVVMLLMTGIDTVGGALANVVTALDRDRAAWRRVVADPSLAAAAYAEGIRLLPPTPMATRIADVDVDLGTITIPAGSTVILMYGAANLDPAVFTDPTTFDLDRNEANSLAFGHGAHYCLGASLAMLQGEIVLQTLARHCPDFTVVGGPARRRAELAFHSFAELDLRLTAQPRRRAPAEA